MKQFTKALAAIMLLLAVFFTTGCKKSDDPNDPSNGGGNPPTTEGIYLGIIGFNYNLFPREIGLLDNSTKSSYTSFIDNLTTENLTGLYYADYTALKKLKQFGEPPRLTNVALVTFTDGLDNASLDDVERNPENYPTRDAYLNALHSKIKTDKIHGLDVNAYTIGLRGNDVQDVGAFQNNLKKLASDDNNVFEVTSMDEALQHFEEIAESLHWTSFTTSLSLLVPPGYDDGLVLRFTFDQVNSANNSSLFIECTYRRTDNGRRLENITYRGFRDGSTSLSSVEQLPNGFYKFVFENLKKDNDSFITEIDKNRLKLFRQITSGWEPETEFDNNNQSSVIEEQNSALIMLVLDCTTSLGSQFSSLKTAAKRFVETLANANNGGGGNGGGSANQFSISVSANPIGSGTVSGGGNFDSGASRTVTATANEGFAFMNWTENGNVVSTSVNYTFTVNANRTLVANFTTQTQAPTGAINGKYTVSSNGGKVYFSQGNLQYRASTGTWQFAANQYNFIGNNNSNIGQNYNGWIDLFGWGTSGWNCGNTYYRPWDSFNSNGSLYGPSGQHDLTGSYAHSDWGVHNAISNGGNMAGQWRALTQNEWIYVFNTRNTSSGIRYAKARVAAVNGVILLPDEWNSSYYSLSNTNNGDASFYSNVISASDWTNSLQSHGAVFLPAAGYREGTTVSLVGVSGFYWSASCMDSNYGLQVAFDDSGFWTDSGGSRYFGQSVRLVCPAE